MIKKYYYGDYDSGCSLHLINNQNCMRQNARHGVYPSDLKPKNMEKTFMDIANDILSNKEKDMNVVTRKTPKELKDAVLACISITNENLLMMNARLESKRSRFNTNIILQSEALSIFKGNFIRFIKNLYGSADINRIKSNIVYIIELDEVHCIINDINVKWQPREYTPNILSAIMNEVAETFNKITAADIETLGYQSLKDFSERKMNSKREHLKEVSDIHDINFDSITKINLKI